MMGPHWNPRASEIAIVLQGQGMIRVACSSNAKASECKNLRFRVKEGDVFTVKTTRRQKHGKFQISDTYLDISLQTKEAW